jgi:Sec-independent protein secretion pathway component TatC
MMPTSSPALTALSMAITLLLVFGVSAFFAWLFTAPEDHQQPPTEKE